MSRASHLCLPGASSPTLNLGQKRMGFHLEVRFPKGVEGRGGSTPIPRLVWMMNLISITLES